MRELLVLEHLRQRRGLRVQHFAAERQNRLPRAVASLLRGSAGRIALDDEQLAAFGVGVRAVAQLAGKAQPRRRGALARHLRLRGAARFARARRATTPPGEKVGASSSVTQPALARVAPNARP